MHSFKQHDVNLKKIYNKHQLIYKDSHLNPNNMLKGLLNQTASLPEFARQKLVFAQGVRGENQRFSTITTRRQLYKTDH